MDGEDRRREQEKREHDRKKTLYINQQMAKAAEQRQREQLRNLTPQQKQQHVDDYVEYMLQRQQLQQQQQPESREAGIARRMRGEFTDQERAAAEAATDAQQRLRDQLQASLRIEAETHHAPVRERTRAAREDDIEDIEPTRVDAAARRQTRDAEDARSSARARTRTARENDDDRPRATRDRGGLVGPPPLDAEARMQLGEAERLARALHTRANGVPLPDDSDADDAAAPAFAGPPAPVATYNPAAAAADLPRYANPTVIHISPNSRALGGTFQNASPEFHIGFALRARGLEGAHYDNTPDYNDGVRVMQLYSELENIKDRLRLG